LYSNLNKSNFQFLDLALKEIRISNHYYNLWLFKIADW